jgi:signal transduction histidine kinase
VIQYANAAVGQLMPQLVQPLGRTLDVVFPDLPLLHHSNLFKRLESISEFSTVTTLSPADTADDVPVRIKTSVVLDEYGQERGVSLILHDISDIKRAEAEQIKALQAVARARLAEQSDKIKSHFLASLSHELRTPLNVILGYGSMLTQGRLGDLDRRQQEPIARIVGTAEKMLQLIEDVICLRRIEEGDLDIHPTSVLPEDVAAQVYTTIAPRLEVKRQVFEQTLKNKTSSVSLDPWALKLVLTKLLENAVEHSPEGGHIELSLAQEEGTVRFTVADTGPGVSAEAQPHLFSYWQEIDGKQKYGFKGAGFGMALVQALMDLMGGEIQLQSTAGEGCVFTLDFAAEEAER